MTNSAIQGGQYTDTRSGESVKVINVRFGDVTIRKGSLMSSKEVNIDWATFNQYFVEVA